MPRYTKGGLYPLTSNGIDVTLGSGQLKVPDGTAAAPSLASATTPSAGLFFFPNGGNQLPALASVGGQVFLAADQNNGTRLQVTALSFVASMPGVADIVLSRDAANTLALRNGPNAQVVNLYNTSTDAANYERLAIGYVGNVAKIIHQNAGTGAARTLRIETNSGVLELHDGNSVLTLGTSLNVGSRPIIFGVDNTFDIGAVGATRPRTGYFGTSVVAPTFQTTTALITATGAATPAFLTNGVGGAGGPTLSPQNGWVKATDSTGATIWIPVWK